MPAVHRPMRTLVLLPCLLALVPAIAQRPRIEGKRIEIPPTIDGVVEPSEWAAAEPLEGLTILANGRPEPFRTRAWIAYDDQSLYVAFICDDPNPNQLRATEYRRGVSLEGDDRIILVINPFFTQREDDFSQFEVSAGGGSRSRIAGGRAAKREWVGDWDAKARITDGGYEVEIRIPWGILPLPPPGERDLDINVGRFYQRHQFIAAFANIGQEERHDRHAIWSGVDLPAVARGQVVQMLPYQVIGYDDERDAVFNTGLDMRYQINSQLSVLGSVNPDFQNVENAVLNLEFSRFERLADERRPFFVEGGDFFRMGGSARAFASQRIGQFDVGGKVFGKLTDDSQIGALATARFGHSVNSVVRYKKTFDKRSSFTAGWVYSDREDLGITNHTANMELMLDGERWGVGAIHALTEDTAEGAGKRVDFDVFYHDDAIRGHFGWQQISPKFLPRIGFAPRRGFKGWNASFGYEKAFSTGPVADISGGVGFVDSERWDGSGVFLDDLGGGGEIVFRNGLAVGAGYGESNFKGSIARIASFSVEFPENDPYRNIGGELTLGTVEGDPYRLVEIGGQYRFPFRLSVSGRLGFETLGGQTEQLHVFGTNFELSEFQSIGGRMVMRDSKINWYLSYRQSGNFGVEYYFIVGDPNAETFQKRVVLKVVVPFDVRF